MRKLIGLIATTALVLQSGVAFAATGDGQPVGRPDPVTNVSANIPDNTVTDTNVTWTIPASDGGSVITGYSVTAFSGANYDQNTGAGCTVAGAAATACTVLGLAFNTSYKFSVVASNAVGSSDPVLSAALSTPSQSQTVTISNTPVSKTFGDSAFQLSATATSGLPVAWSSGTQSICSIDNAGFVSILSAGTCTITATQDGSGSAFAPASDTDSFAINSSLSATIGAASNVQATSASLSANVAFGGTNTAVQFCVVTTNSTANCTAPAGVSISTASPATITSSSGAATSANVSGLTRGETYFFFVIASAGGNEVRSATATFATPVSPTLTLTGPATGQANQSFSTTVTASSGSGIYATWGATGLPAGLTLTPEGTQATISGTPTVAGVTTATINVTDSLGQSASLQVQITITAATPPPGGGGGGGGGGDTADETGPAPKDEDDDSKDDEDKDDDSKDDDADKPKDEDKDDDAGTGTKPPVEGETGPVGGNALPNPRPGTSTGSSGGSSIAVTQRTEGDSLIISGGGASVQLSVKVADQTTKLVAGNQLNLTITGTLEISATGFDPNTNFISWLFEPVAKIASFKIDSAGRLNTAFRIPSQPYVGPYVLQLVGIKDGKQIAFSIGVNVLSLRVLANAFYFKNNVKLDKWELRKVTKYRKAIKPRATFTCIGYVAQPRPSAAQRKVARERAANLCAAATQNLLPAKIKLSVRVLAKAPPAKKSSNRQKLQRADLKFKNPR